MVYMSVEIHVIQFWLLLLSAKIQLFEKTERNKCVKFEKTERNKCVNFVKTERNKCVNFVKTERNVP